MRVPGEQEHLDVVARFEGKELVHGLREITKCLPSNEHHCKIRRVVKSTLIPPKSCDLSLFLVIFH